jgi:hypothetical protein
VFFITGANAGRSRIFHKNYGNTERAVLGPELTRRPYI